MRLRIIKVNNQEPEEENIKLASKVLVKGGLVIVPTETVYGIAADMRNQEAIQHLYRIKQRPKDKPFSLLIDSKEKVEDFVSSLSPLAYKLVDKFWPGPLTLVLPAKNSHSTVGLRMPDNIIALRLIAAVGAPLVCPSANLSGKPAPVNLEQALQDLSDKVDLAIDGGRASIGRESSVVEVSQTSYQIRREGAISSEEIQRVCQKKVVLFVCTGNSCRSVMAKAFLEKKLKESNRDDVEVLSAGILGIPNLRASSETKQILKKEGIDVEEHIALKVTGLMLKKSDIILVMERMHEEKILELAPQAKTRLFLLKEFAKIEDSPLDIEDPIGRPIEFHERIFNTIKESVNRIVQVI